MGLYFGAICLQETWLSSDADVSLLHISGYKLIHQGSKCTRHGGLIIYIHEEYTYKLRNIYTQSDIWEGLFIDVSGQNLRQPITIGNIYKPPHSNNNNANIERFIEEISPIINRLQKENKYAAIVGDFNINHLQINEREKFEEFFDLMCTNNFFPKITLPTRSSKKSCTLIDQMFCKSPHLDHTNIFSSIIMSKISDHFPCLVKLEILNEKPKRPKYIQKRVITEAATHNFREELHSSDISSHLNANLMTDPNPGYDIFERIALSAYEKHFPNKRVKVNKHKHKLSPWITTGLIKSIEFRDKLYKRLKSCPQDSPEHNRMEYNLKTYNGYLKQCIRTAKREYYVHEFTKYKNDIRKTWDILKDIINTKKSKSDFPPYFTDLGIKISGSKTIADKFNEYFTKIGPELARSIDTSHKIPFDNYLKSPCQLSFQFQYTTPDSIEKNIGDLKPKSSAGCDNLSSKLLKDIKGIISRPLSIIINRSLCSGIFPSKLKLAKVIPLYKKEDQRVFGNYRPISLLSSISKIFEKVAFKQILEYFTSNNLLFESQYGFRENHSTELAALEFIDRIKLEMDRKKIPFSIFLDLSKAFDTLNHDILLTKLRYFGIQGIALNWFQSYLTKRSQYVQYNDTSSSIREIKTGVPQGSILGPLLFIIYMNDIHTVSDKFSFIIYADDTTLISPLCSFSHCSHNDMNYVSTMINLELTKISDWLAVNKLSLNATKTKFMLFHDYQKIINEDDIPHLTINDTVIERVTEFNFLGLTINEFMNWNSHSSKISNKLSRTLGVMNRLKRYLPFSAWKLMYSSLILSHLQFAITSWGFEWERLSKLQKRALRIMTNSKYNAHTDPLFKSLKLLKIKDIFDVQCMKFWYKFVNNNVPTYFASMFRYNHELYEIQTRSHELLHLYPFRTSNAHNAPRHRIPELLCKFPTAVLEKARTHSIMAFASHVKFHLIDSYCSECVIPQCYICARST